MYLLRTSDITFVATADGLVIQEVITIYVVGVPVSRRVEVHAVVI